LSHFLLAAGGYQAAEGRKHRKLLLSELKGLVPTSHCSLLAALLLQSDVLLPQPAAEQQAAAVQAAEGAAHTAQMAGDECRCSNMLHMHHGWYKSVQCAI
jgi:hypothetical protein